MANLTSYLNPEKKDSELIWQFAFLGDSTNQAIRYNELSSLAEPEN
ncbi:MAG: hypothetical protein L0I48_05270 [Lactococcus plantarum]|nr:hypothetical protein [Lactococcus plantarum]